MTLSVQFATMMAMCVMGLWIGVSVDTYGRLFYRGPRRRWHPIQIAGDLLFWLIQGLLVFLVLLYINNGAVRIYIFLALLLGYAAYRSLFASMYRHMLEFLIRACLFSGRIAKATFWYVLALPVLWVLKIVYYSCKIILKGTGYVLYFAVKIIWVPLTRLLPDAFLQKIYDLPNRFKKQAGITKAVQKIKDRLKTWLEKIKK